MYKVMIVEDEMLVRTGIRASIKWENHNMYVVNEAANGKIGWELYQECLPDVILTDIKMPFMDGIELIQKIRETGNPVQLIILTCLEDFSLAQQAIRLGVSGYILKLTMTPEDMESVLSEIQKTLDNQNRHSSKTTSPVNLNDYIAKNLLGYLVYDICPLSVCLTHLKEQGICLYSRDVVMVAMEIEQYEDLQSLYQDEQGQLIHFSLLNIINEILNRNHVGVVVHEVSNRYLLLFGFTESTGQLSRITDILNEISEILKNYFNVTARYYLSHMEQSLESLKDMYRQCQSTMVYAFFMENTPVISFDSIYTSKLFYNVLQKTKESLKIYKDDSFMEDFIFSPLTKYVNSHTLNETSVKSLFCDAWIALVHNYQLSVRDHSRLVMKFINECNLCKTYYAVLALFIKNITALKNDISQKTKYSREIVQALQYLQSNYQKQTTLNEIADVVGLSPNYFSTIFKKELSLSFSEYLSRYRIEKSIELLITTNLKTYEIAWQSGYSDEGYFGKTFKKYTGKTPNEYRKTYAYRIAPDSSEGDI